MEMGGLLQDFFSFVVAMSSTADTSECSVAPVNFFIFHTSACFLLSYFALPACACQRASHGDAGVHTMHSRNLLSIRS